MSGYGARSPRWSARSDSTKRPARADVGGKRGEVPLPLARIGARGDGLLGLVHDQGLAAPGLQPGQRVQGARPRRRHEHRCPCPGQRCDHAGQDQRGLADARRPDHGEDLGVSQPPQAGVDVVLAAEEGVRVLGAVRQQPSVGADRADRRAPRGGRSDGSCRSSSSSSSASSRPGSRPSSSASMVRARFTAPRASACRPALVQRGREQHPAPLPERRLGDQRPRLLQHRLRVPGAELGRRRAAPRRPCEVPRDARPPPARAPTPRGRPGPLRATGPAPRCTRYDARAGSSPSSASRAPSSSRSNRR